MNSTDRTEPSAATTPAAQPRRRRKPTPAQHRPIRRVARLIAYGVLTGAATTAGKAAGTALIWWLHNH
jgi:hypothetical protein